MMNNSTKICLTRAPKNKKQKDIFTYLSLFSGIGGFELGIQQSMPYAKCVGFSETNPYAKSIYQRVFKSHKDYKDVTEINENELPEFDCLVAGFPCQPFSLSGKRQGFNDTRGTLFFDIVRILRAKRPKVFVLENVQGLLSHDEGRTFGVIIKTLDELWYDVQWQVLNCKHHGTPQDRNRVFIVGYSRAYDQSGKKILPIRYSGSKVVEGRKPKVIGNTNPSGTGRLKIFHSERVFTAKDSNEMGGSLGLLSRNNGICYALTKKHANHIVQLTKSSLIQDARVYDPYGIGVTLKSKGSNEIGTNTELYLIKNRVRRLTPIECERLQDIPDGHTKFGKNNEVISDAQRYACIGNAVNSKVIQIIFDKLKDALIDKKEEEKILIPRVVSFSGGRTSAMMLLQLLKKDELKQWRGDCVVFNNTSAEHSATYAFVSRIKKITEEKYNIPFFMTEFCTYEAKTNKGGYTRRITYKLVNDLPYCKHNNIHGYKFKGEVFEESISQTGVLPSTFQRNCTINMKILTTNNFLTDWMASKTYIDQQGEFSKVSNISDADIVKKHRIYNGELSDAVIIDKKTFVRSCQAFRPKQFFKDFTNADINYNNPYLKEKTTDGRVSIFGKDAIKYHNYIGIRFDEKHRAIKIRKRIKDAKKNLSRSGKNKISSAKTQPPFENANMPMIKAKINKQKVIDFWKNPARSKYDLDLPYDGMLSNCVHCMLKGKSKNQLISKKAQAIALDNTNALTPNSIKWWARIEQKYSRKVIKSDKNEYTNIGFFGASKAYVYQTWVDELGETNEEDLIKLSEEDSWNMDCNCTD